ncbi:MAG: MgtC/SapB family protein [Gemmatimonadota bacterium]
MDPEFLLQLAVALGLGLLVGLQREWAVSRVAGIRTFTLITLAGLVVAIVAERFGGWIFGAGLLSLAAFVVLGNLILARSEDSDPGMTTEVAAVLMFVVGGALAIGYTALAVVVGGTVAVLLHWKEPLHSFADRIGREDFEAVIRLALIALVILPVLPNRSFGPYRVLNPFEIWLMVVLIVGISMAGYVAYKALGPRAGTVATGLLGGLISSTATSIGFARRAHGNPDRSPAAALIVVLASTVAFARVLVEVAIVAPRFLTAVAPPLVAMMVAMTMVAASMYGWERAALGSSAGEQDPPSNLRAAIAFGVVYAVVLFAVAAARARFGEGALYGVAALSGLTDMDAITLSTAQLLKDGDLDVVTGWRLILVGGMANLVFKGGAVAVLGPRKLLTRVGVAFALSLGAGGAILAFWPG